MTELEAAADAQARRWFPDSGDEYMRDVVRLSFMVAACWQQARDSKEIDSLRLAIQKLESRIEFEAAPYSKNT